MNTPRDESEPSHAPHDDARPARALRTELAVTFVISVLLTGALAVIQSSVAWLAGYVYIAVALVFVVLPTWVVQRWRRGDPVRAGMRFGGLVRGLAWGLGATVATLIPFVIGFHLWTTVALGQHADPGLSRYQQWDESSAGRPFGVDDGGARGVWVWTERDRVRVWWRTDGAPLEVGLRSTDDAAALEILAVQGAQVAEREGARVSVRGRAGAPLSGVDLKVEPGAVGLTVAVLRAGEPVAAEAVAVGGAEAPASENPLVLERGLFWIVNLLLVQLFFVGLPEEYFYRGYVQPTLARLTGERARGVMPWRAIVVASVLFALGHVLVEFAVLRLTVFFPSLLFGWLRERSGGLIAPLVYHAMCNSLVELAQVHYSM